MLTRSFPSRTRQKDGPEGQDHLRPLVVSSLPLPVRVQMPLGGSLLVRRGSRWDSFLVHEAGHRSSARERPPLQTVFPIMKVEGS